MNKRLPGLAYNLAKTDKGAELYIYDVIGADMFGEGVTAKNFAREVKDLGEVSDITVRINSMGGAVYDALAIYNILSNHEANVTVRIEGMAMSAASVIAMAGDTIEIAENATVMIHEPWGVAIGNAEDMVNEAAILEKITSGLVDTYEARTKRKKDDIRKMMKDETWMVGQEAIDNGFADKLIPAKRVAAHVDPATYLNIPDRVLQCMTVIKEPEKANLQSKETVMDIKEFQAYAEKNPEWVAKYREEGKRASLADGHAEAKTELKALMDAAGEDIKLAVESFMSGKDSEDVKAIVADRAAQAKSHAEQVAKLAEENAQLKAKAELAASGAAAVPATPAASAEQPKWDGKNPLSIHNFVNKTTK